MLGRDAELGERIAHGGTIRQLDAERVSAAGWHVLAQRSEQFDVNPHQNCTARQGDYQNRKARPTVGFFTTEDAEAEGRLCRPRPAPAQRSRERVLRPGAAGPPPLRPL